LLSPPRSYEQDASSGLLTVHFRGGQQPPVTAGLLVAADGYFSRVRRQAVGDGPPAYGKTVVWRARLPAASAVAAGLDLQDSSVFVQDVGRFLFALPISSGDYVWTVGVTGGRLLLQGCEVGSGYL
jgi:2-polyprenyl-6-methoxyphenol hydroxylase-like FAD-dependent oxidoreductase